jgi:hypothetical protein
VTNEPWWKPDLRDVLALAGTGLLALGAGMVYLPAAPIIIGVLLLVLSRPWAS